VTDWLRCYSLGLVAFAWAALLHFHVVSSDRFPWVAFLVSVGGAYGLHVQREREKNREQDEELARLRDGEQA